MMKVLVTGSSGMVGKNLCNYLDNLNYFVLRPTRDELDLMNLSQIQLYLKVNKPDCVVHCAGLVGGIQANISKPFSFLYINCQIGLNLINACIEQGISKLINLGSSCMYPKDSKVALKEDMILSGHLEPTNEGYAIAKIVIAKLCEFANNQNGFNYKTIIPCNLYGKYDKFDPASSHMIPAVIRKIHNAYLGNYEPVIWGDGSARREFMYAEDLADFIEWSLNNYEKLDPLTNIGLGFDYSILDYYKEISKVVGYKGKFTFDKTKPEGMKKKLCSIEKQNKLGWFPKHSLNEGLKKTYKFYLANYEI